MKRCVKCSLEQPLAEFYVAKKTGRARDECRTCVKAYVKQWQKDNKERFAGYVRRSKLKSAYGLNQEDYSAMVQRQDGVCAICRNPPKPETSLCVDHCHATGRVRGLLCHLCNSALGELQDDPDLLRRAAAYISNAGVSTGRSCSSSGSR